MRVFLFEILLVCSSPRYWCLCLLRQITILQLTFGHFGGLNSFPVRSLSKTLGIPNVELDCTRCIFNYGERPLLLGTSIVACCVVFTGFCVLKWTLSWILVNDILFVYFMQDVNLFLCVIVFGCQDRFTD